jgi:hypothetical protein
MAQKPKESPSKSDKISYEYNCPICQGLNYYTPKHSEFPDPLDTYCSFCDERLKCKKDAVKCSNQKILNFQPARRPTCKNIPTRKQLPNVVRKYIVDENSIEEQAEILLGNFAEETMFEAHNLRFKIPIFELKEDWDWQRETDMNNWVKKMWKSDDFLIEQTSSSIIISISKAICSNDFNKALDVARIFCMDIAHWLRTRGFAVGKKIKMIDKPHIVIPRKSAPELAKLGVKYYIMSEDKFIIDDSKDNGKGEIEIVSGLEVMNQIFDTPKHLNNLAKNTVILQETVLEMKKIIEQQQQTIQKMQEFIISEHNLQPNIFSIKSTKTEDNNVRASNS